MHITFPRRPVVLSQVHKVVCTMLKISLSLLTSTIRSSSLTKPSALEEADEPEPKERTMTDVKLTKGLGRTEVVSRCFEDIDFID